MNAPAQPDAHKPEGTLVCFALEQEAAPFRKYSKNRPGLHILITGIGRANSEKSLRSFLATRSPALALTCGFAGALDPRLAVGTVVFETDDPALRAGLAAAGAAPGKFLCADRIATTAAEKEQLRRSTGADAVEMESEAIRILCRERGIRCATLRAISDCAGEDLPLDFNKLSGPDWNLDYGKLALAIAASPTKIGALLRLQRQCKTSAAALARVLAALPWSALGSSSVSG